MAFIWQESGLRKKGENKTKAIGPGVWSYDAHFKDHVLCKWVARSAPTPPQRPVDFSYSNGFKMFKTR